MEELKPGGVVLCTAGFSFTDGFQGHVSFLFSVLELIQDAINPLKKKILSEDFPFLPFLFFVSFSLRRNNPPSQSLKNG